uniref:Uncharacterized protein n=1 Tax=Cajanus cajan TaxID=3821 RepID=A0A151S537_CAJCA|nr:hypothetical protein KK1_028305 [Cajanus cajan]
MKGQKIEIDVDPNTGTTSGPNSVQFASYLGTLARDKINILVPSWKEVPQATKDLIWQDILEVYQIEDNAILREKILQHVSTRFRQYKFFLTRVWINGKQKGNSPCDKYNIDPEDWEKFKQVRNDPKWQAIREKAQAIQEHNDAPNLLSRGGYGLLVTNYSKNELKRLKEEAIKFVASQDVVIDPPPPPCHKLWVMARTKSSGEMSSESANQIAKKINELDEQASQGSFVPNGRQDILNTALGRPEHPGRVRTAGVGNQVSEGFLVGGVGAVEETNAWPRVHRGEEGLVGVAYHALARAHSERRRRVAFTTHCWHDSRDTLPLHMNNPRTVSKANAPMVAFKNSAEETLEVKEVKRVCVFSCEIITVHIMEI